MIKTWMEKAGRVIRWLMLHPVLGVAGLVLLAVPVLLVLTCPSPQPPPAHPGEAARGAAAGSLPLSPASQAQLDAAADALLARNAELAAQVQALEAEVGRLTTVLVVDARTKGVAVKAPKRPSGDDKKQEVPAGTTGEAATPAYGDLLPSGSDRPVALYEGERLVLRIQGVGKRTGDGQGFLPATIGAYTSDGQRLGLDVLNIPLSKALESPPPAAALRSWRVLAGGGVSGQGWQGAVGLETPGARVPLLPLKVGAWAMLAGGPRQGAGFVGVWFEHYQR